MNHNKSKRASLLSQFVVQIRSRNELAYYNGHYYKYREGCHYRVSSDEVRSLIFRVLGSHSSMHDIKEVDQKLRLECLITTDLVDISKQKLNVRNGILDPDTLVLSPHKPDNFNVNQLSVEYNPDSKCPRFMKFLDEIFEGETENGKAIQEYMGYQLIPDNRFDKALICYGYGANGKGTLIKVNQTILGRSNYSCIPVERFGDRFEAAYLQHMMANFSSEIPKKAMINDARFKEIVSGDNMRAEWKNGDLFFFRPYAKLVVLANHYPRSSDYSYAFTRRLLTVPFNHRFDEDNRDEQLTEKLLEERSGIFNWVLGGRQRLLHQKRFTQTLQMKELMANMVAESNPVRAFVADSCELGPGFIITKDGLYQAHIAFCKNVSQHRGNTLTKKAFGRELLESFHGIIGDRKSEARLWRGIRLSDDN